MDASPIVFKIYPLYKKIKHHVEAITIKNSYNKTNYF